MALCTIKPCLVHQLSPLSALSQVVKDLKQLPEEESVGVLKIAEDIKNQLEEFKPYAPLVVGLRIYGSMVCVYFMVDILW